MANPEMLPIPIRFVPAPDQAATAHLQARLEELRTGSYTPENGWLNEKATVYALSYFDWVARKKRDGRRLKSPW
jgi:hypothetical protein